MQIMQIEILEAILTQHLGDFEMYLCAFVSD